MSQYTPSTESVRSAFIADGGWTAEDRAAMFDRWLAEELRQAKETAYAEGVEANSNDHTWTQHLLETNPYRSQP